MELEVSLSGGVTQRYLLPLAAAWGEEHLAPGSPLLPFTLAKCRRGPGIGALYDATHADGFPRELLGAMREGRRSAGRELRDPLLARQPPRRAGAARRCGGPAPGRRAEQQLGAGRREGHRQDLPAPRGRHPPGAGDRPLPDRGGALHEHAAAPGLHRAGRCRRLCRRPMRRRSASSPTRATAGPSPSTIWTGHSRSTG